MAKDVLYIRDRVYIPARHVDIDGVKSRYSKRMYQENNCANCEYKRERHAMVCETCPAFKGTVKLYNKREIRGTQYVGLPIGDKACIERYAGISFSDYKIVDKRIRPKFDVPVKFTLELRKHQEQLAVDFLKKKYGLIKAPPRTGKTALMLHLAIKLGYKMCLLANQHEFLQQFLWHIEGNEAEGIPKCTNLPELEKKYKKKLYGFPKTEEDFKNFQFMVMTYQQFLSKTSGKKRLALLNGSVGTVAVDEVHKGASDTFAKVLNSLHAAYKFGVTGTVERKDGRHFIVKRILGPVVASTEVDVMVPKIYVHETKTKFRTQPKLWVYATLKLANNEARNKFIVKNIIKDVKAGHGVVVPTPYKKHVLELVRLINQTYGKKIAAAYMGGGSSRNKIERQQVLTDAKSGKIKVVVGIRSLLQLGLNVPKWSSIHECMPISNEPNLKQETSRVRTPYEGKPQPIVRLYYDQSMGLTVGCARSCLTHMKKFKYELSDDSETVKNVEFIMQSRRRRQYDEDDAYAPTSTFKESKTKMTGMWGNVTA